MHYKIGNSSLRYLAAVVLLLLALHASGQVEFSEVTTREEMELAQKKASDGQLMLFVDVYATWCGPCKQMDNQVYTDPDVATYMNEHFISVRMDGETVYGREYAAAQELQGYPSMFIFSKEGEPVSKIIGFTPADELITSLKGTVDNYREMRTLRTKYSRGTLETGEFARYISVMRAMGNEEEAERLSSEYMEQVINGRLTDDDLQVVAYYMDVDDPWWPQFSSDRKRLKKVLGEDFMLALEKIYNNSLVAAVESSSIGTISKLSNELAPLVEAEETSSWDLRSLPFIQYYYYTDQIPQLIDYVDDRMASDKTGDHRWLYGAASQITDMDQQYLTAALLEKEEAWFQQCIDLHAHFDYYFYHGMVLFLQKKSAEAKSSFLKAESLVTNDEQQEMIAQILAYVNNQ